MPRQYFSCLHQTSLLLALRLAHRHEDVLLSRLLLVARTLALSLLLRLADRLRALVLLALRLALLGQSHLLLLRQFTETGGRLNVLCRDTIIEMAACVVTVLATFLVAH